MENRNPSKKGPRIDKWLWAVRIFKTRTDAAEAVKKNKVLVNGVEVKPSRELKIGDIITIKRPLINYKFKVLNFIENRQPAKNVPIYAENLTSQEEIEQIKIAQSSIFIKQDRGAGRPTKKNRRDIEDFIDNLLDWEEE